MRNTIGSCTHGMFFGLIVRRSFGEGPKRALLLLLVMVE
jgi:hypothetical protein